MDDDVEGRAAEQADPNDQNSWHAFAAGNFDAIVDARSTAELEDDEWRSRNPVHHIADMYVHRYGEAGGRSSPAEFWWGTLLFVFVTAAIFFSVRFHSVFRMVLIGWVLLGLVAVISAAIRRMHDTDRSGAKLGSGFISAVSLLTKGGDPKPNDYGEPRMKHVGPVGKKMYRR